MPKISGGYYMKARSIQRSAIIRKPPHVREIWDYLLMNANHTTQIYNGNMVERGQLFRTYDAIRDALSWYIGWRKEAYTEDQTKKAMKFLRDALMITTARAPGGVLITICNYNTYQDPKSYESTNESPSESTIEAPLEHHPVPTLTRMGKNGKNAEEDNNVKTIVDMLNAATGRSFKYSSKNTSSKITARMNEGFSIDEFKSVIEYKSAQWKSDVDMSEFLRPETLFGTKFESYLQSALHPVEEKPFKFETDALV